MSAKIHNSPAIMDIFALIAQERSRQRELFRKGKHQFRVCSPIISDGLKLAVLTEEVGEVAKEVNENAHRASTPRRREKMETELVQVAAVAVAWIEALEVPTTKEGK